MTDLPDYATRKGNVVYVETAAQAMAILDFVTDDDYIVIRDFNQSRLMNRCHGVREEKSE